MSPTATGVARSATFADVTWLGLPPYWQILTAAIPGTPALLPQTSLFADAGSAYDAADQSNCNFAMTAVGTAKRSGDRILVDLASTFAGTRAASMPQIGDLS